MILETEITTNLHIKWKASALRVVTGRAILRCGYVSAYIWSSDSVVLVKHMILVILIEVEDEYKLVWFTRMLNVLRQLNENQTFFLLGVQLNQFCVLASDLFGNIVSCSVFNVYSCFVNLLNIIIVS